MYNGTKFWIQMINLRVSRSEFEKWRVNLLIFIGEIGPETHFERRISRDRCSSYFELLVLFYDESTEKMLFQIISSQCILQRLK